MTNYEKVQEDTRCMENTAIWETANYLCGVPDKPADCGQCSARHAGCMSFQAAKRAYACGIRNVSEAGGVKEQLAQMYEIIEGHYPKERAKALYAAGYQKAVDAGI